MNYTLERRHSRLLARGLMRESGGEWILWMDWDAIVTDLSFTLPLEEYEVSAHLASRISHTPPLRSPRANGILSVTVSPNHIPHAHPTLDVSA